MSSSGKSVIAAFVGVLTVFIGAAQIYPYVTAKIDSRQRSNLRAQGVTPPESRHEVKAQKESLDGKVSEVKVPSSMWAEVKTRKN
jgi:hypothetical protein